MPSDFIFYPMLLCSALRKSNDAMQCIGHINSSEVPGQYKVSNMALLDCRTGLTSNHYNSLPMLFT